MIKRPNLRIQEIEEGAEIQDKYIRKLLTKIIEEGW
jgi:ribosomal protein L20A (L18A)